MSKRLGLKIQASLISCSPLNKMMASALTSSLIVGWRIPHDQNLILLYGLAAAIASHLSFLVEWIEVNPISAEQSGQGPFRSSALQKTKVYNELKQWRLEIWEKDWRDNWPSYGPKTLVSDCDLECISNRAGSSIFTIKDVRRYTHVIHWPELGVPLMNALRAALVLVHGSDVLAPQVVQDRGTVRVFEEVAGGEVAGDANMSTSRPSVSKRQRTGAGALQPYENIMTM